MTTNTHLGLLRSLIRELRLSLNTSKIQESSLYEYILKEYRKNIFTDLQFCRERDEIAFIGKTYATYLNSRRNLKRLHEEYHGRGERSIKETASIVGFKLPHDP